MADTDLTAVEKRRSQLLAEMTPATKEIAQEFHELLGTAARGVMLVHFDFGCRIAAMVAEEDTYGMNAVNQLAEFLNVPSQYLYQMKNVAESFDRKYVEAMTLKPMKDGNYLTKQHWIHLTQIQTQGDRDKMLKRVLRESLSANDLEKEIQAGSGGKTRPHSRAGGKKPAKPSSPFAGLQKVFGLSQQWKNFADVADESVFDAIDEMAPDNINEDTLTKLQTTEAAAVKVQEKAVDMVERIRKNIVRVQKVLKSRPKETEGNGKFAPKSAGGMAGRKVKKNKKAKKKASASA